MSEDQPTDPSSPDKSEADEKPVLEGSGNMNLFASVWVKVEVNEEDDVQIKKEPSDRPLTATTSKLHEHEFRRGPYKKCPPEAKRFKCDLCDYRTQHRNILKCHIMSHTDPKPFTCDQCDYKTMYPMSLKRHTYVRHAHSITDKEKLPIHRCGVCSYETHFKWNLSSHERKHDLTKQHKCPHCSYTTAYKHSLKKHSRTHNKPVESTYYCDKCPFTTKYEGHISRHMAKIHFEISEKASQCEHCTFSTKTGWRLNTHRKRSKQEKPIKCVHCDYQSMYRCAFREHKLSHNETNQLWSDSLLTINTNVQLQNVENAKNDQASEIIKMCEIRSKIDADTGTGESETTKLYDELKNKLNEDTYYIYNHNTRNSLSLPNVTQMTEHEKNNHYLLDPNCEVTWNKIQVIESPNQDRPFQCMTCNYSAKFKASVQRHYQRHHNSHNRPYRCMNCDFSTKTKDQIALHNKRSKSDEILTCKICAFTSVFKCQFAMHEKEHYPFKCVHCEYTCKKKPDIQKHFTIVHLGQGLKCRHCDFRAGRKESLLSHEVIHTGKKPFQCQLCEYSSVRRFLLENHLNRFHKVEMVAKINDNPRTESVEQNDVDVAESQSVFSRRE